MILSVATAAATALRNVVHGQSIVERSSDVSGSVRAFDRWAHHPAAFTFPGLSEALRRVDPGPGALVGDPFAGSARAGTRVTARGQHFWGLEAHPLLCSLGQLKFRRPGPEEDLLAAVERIAIVAEGPSVVDGEHPALVRMVHPAALGQLCAARQALVHDDGPWSEHLRWLVLSSVAPVRSVPVDA